MNYLIRFIQKRDLRLLLRYNYQQKINHSSLYRINNFYYILLDSKIAINFPENIRLTVIENKINAEGYLFNWAESEILQSMNYIEFEQNSVLSNNGRMADYFGTYVYRCQEQLADIFAVLNYTSDSFSDGGRFNQIDRALAQIEYLCSFGGCIIDLGVQSTRPAANKELDSNSEIKLLKQILPHVLDLKAKLKFELSIDTYHPDTVLWLDNFAIDIINDVSGSLPIDVIKPILNANKRYVAMHSLSIPANPDIVLAGSVNPLNYLRLYLTNKVETIASSGCDITNLILDPGIGFGMTKAQAWFVLRNLDNLCNFPCEMLIGHSRKLFFSHITSKKAPDRDLETAVAAAHILPYVDYLRLHDLELFNQINSVFNQFG